MERYYMIRSKRWYQESTDSWVDLIKATRYTTNMQAIEKAQDLALHHKDIEVHRFERRIVWHG